MGSASTSEHDPHLRRWGRFAISLVCIAFLASLTQARAEPPNIVFIMADDCTYWDIGCYGGQALTPNIDALAKEGARFTQCFQAAPMCSPTRHNILTGLYPMTSGAYPNHTFAKSGTKSIGHYLKALGYRVALSGKTHIAPRPVFPFEYSGLRDNPDMEAVDRLMSESVKSDTPFCLFAMSNEPHAPWDRGDSGAYTASALKLPGNWVDTPVARESMTRYLAEITFFDGQVGEILALLDKHGLAENTLVMVLSEQGSQFPFAKWTCYDAGLQSAMVVRWPGVVAKDQVLDALVEYVDITPTFVEVAGGVPAEVLQGASLVSLLKGSTKVHKTYVFGEMTTRGIVKGSPHYGIRSVRSAQYKLIWNLTPEVPFSNVASHEPTYRSWVKEAETHPELSTRVERYVTRPKWELYDVSKDRFEQNNLADNPEYAAIKRRLEKELKQWMAQCGDKGQETELAARTRQGRPQKKASPKK